MSQLTFYGDLFLTRAVDLALALPEHYVVNLEAPFTKAEPGYPGKINLRGSVEAFDKTLTPRPAAACLANNHIMDFFEPGFSDTVRALEQRTIPYFGAGYLRDNCNNPLVLDIAGESVGLMGYVCPTASPVFAEGERPGCIPISVRKIADDIELAKQKGAKHLVVHLHWGAEQVALPRPEDIATAREVVALGADLLVGHHAHCVQAFEVVQDTHVFYGLGNWMFSAHESPSFFTAEGVAEQVYKSNLHEKNKRSLAVSYDLVTRAVAVEPHYFDGERLTRGRFDTTRFRTTFDLDGYEQRFARAFKWGKFKHILDGYLAAPKLPRPKHVANLFKLARTKQYD